MDGKTLTNGLNQILQESSTSSWIDLRSSYDYLYEAVCEFVRETQCLTATQDITTVATQAAYTLNPDYFFLYLTDDENNLFIKFDDGTSETMIPFREYSSVIYDNQTTSQAIPNNFSITDKRGVTTNITGATSADGAASGGECTLTDTGTTFLSSVSVGDVVHNVTDGSDGVVISIVSNLVLTTALFGGTNNDWTSGDSYVIVPQGRKQLFFSPPPSTSGYTATLEYVQKPLPVYSLYQSYRFNPSYMSAIIKYAAWLYKYRDREPSFADAFFRHWDMQVRRMKASEGKATKRISWKFNLVKRSMGSRSYR
jgi:hypothetical protein